MLTKLPDASTIQALRFDYLCDEHATISTLAAKYELTAYRVAQLLKGPDFDSFKETVQSQAVSNARDILHRSAESAASLWASSMVPAALKGDHRPMKDLLQSVHAIDPDSSAPAVVIQIGLAASDVQVLGPAGQTIDVSAVPDAVPATDLASLLPHTSESVPD